MCWTPFIGLGAGFAMLDADTDDGVVSGSDNSSEFVWGANAGVSLEMTKRNHLESGYRYLDPEEMSIPLEDSFGTDAGELTADLSAHQLFVAWRFMFHWFRAAAAEFCAQKNPPRIPARDPRGCSALPHREPARLPTLSDERARGTPRLRRGARAGTPATYPPPLKANPAIRRRWPRLPGGADLLPGPRSRRAPAPSPP